MATILLVDDEDIFCELLKGLLNSHGHQVFTAYNGHDALKLFQQHHPQITVLDLVMPEMNGIEVLRQIRAVDPKAAAMILTAAGTVELEQQARQLGAVDFLSKQMMFDAIIALVESAVKEPDKRFVPGSVLLVDDSDLARDRFEPFLLENGVIARVVKDGLTAMPLIKNAPPKLIVLNMDLGRIENPGQADQNQAVVQFLEGLRQAHYTGGLILMTYMAGKAAYAGILNSLIGVNYLHKPVTPERLLVAIQTNMVTARKMNPPKQNKA
jgi:DNA-binding NtrC family response regulator